MNISSLLLYAGLSNILCNGSIFKGPRSGTKIYTVHTLLYFYEVILIRVKYKFKNEN